MHVFSPDYVGYFDARVLFPAIGNQSLVFRWCKTRDVRNDLAGGKEVCA